MKKRLLEYGTYVLVLLTLSILNFVIKSEGERYSIEYQEILNGSKSRELIEKIYAKEDSIITLSQRISELTNPNE